MTQNQKRSCWQAFHDAHPVQQGTTDNYEPLSIITLNQKRSCSQVFHDAMSLTETEAQPRSEEACRAIRFFMSSLFNPHLATPRPVELMRSLTTLVPHYEEDVLYPLDNAEVHPTPYLPSRLCTRTKQKS